MVRLEQARSVIHAPLPPVPADVMADSVTLVLFYQYIEPAWTAKQHSEALKHVMALGKEHGVGGRGRCAAEGLNCTLTGPPAGVRAFCMGLRAWNPIFNQTDFKLTDGLAPAHGFKALTIRKVEAVLVGPNSKPKVCFSFVGRVHFGCGSVAAWVQVP